jgi:hypothetical protein
VFQTGRMRVEKGRHRRTSQIIGAECRTLAPPL